jgi:hypothetical protein
MHNADGKLGKSDPYVRATWLGVSLGRTKVRATIAKKK